MKLLADADYLVGLFRKNDSHHKSALKIAESSLKNNLYISIFTIPEVATVLSYKEGQVLAKQFVSDIKHLPFIELEYSKATQVLADQIFLKQSKKGTSWFDCFNVAVIQMHHLDGILSFDKFYSRQGIRNFAV